ncbi:MAG TPA: PDDEXK nuclease domain-containing protein [Opitutaceae bacterium]
MKSLVPLDPGYLAFVDEMKARVAAARLSAARAVNRDLILLYWDIGRAIEEKQRTLGWGKSVVETLANDLRTAFPLMTGFSARNVWDMRRLYESYTSAGILAQAVRDLGHSRAKPILRRAVAELSTDETLPQPVAVLTEAEAVEFLQQTVAEIPWGQNLLLLNKVAEPAARLYYLRATARFGWSRRVLLNQIKAGAYERSLKNGKLHNFPAALPEHLAEQAEEALKSSYNLEFLGIGRAIKERELEDRLVERLREFILELGYGFCFIGRQYRLALGAKEYFVDLLFYHRFLKALVAIDLKIGAFEPEFSGKMDFYLNLLNDTERAPDDRPSIGIILCAEKDNLEVEYALKTKANPIGVAEYRLQPTLPAAFKGKLPTARQLSAAIRPILPGS